MSSPPRPVVPAVNLTDCRNCRVTINTAPSQERPRILWLVKFGCAIGRFFKWIAALASRTLSIGLGCALTIGRA